MAVREIAKYGEDILRVRCKPVARVTKETKTLIQDMIETTRRAAGLGLGAPQVRIPQRVFVYDVGVGPEALFNPEILEEEGAEMGVEGCLSIPKLQGEVSRATRILVRGLDREGKGVKI